MAVIRSKSRFFPRAQRAAGGKTVRAALFKFHFRFRPAVGAGVGVFAGENAEAYAGKKIRAAHGTAVKMVFPRRARYCGDASAYDDPSRHKVYAGGTGSDTGVYKKIVSYAIFARNKYFHSEVKLLSSPDYMRPPISIEREAVPR